MEILNQADTHLTLLLISTWLTDYRQSKKFKMNIVAETKVDNIVG